MTYPVESYYLTFGGTLVRDEIWQNGLHFAPVGGEDIFEGAFDAMSLTDIWDDVSSWFASGDAISAPGSGIQGPCTLGWLKLAVLDRAGDYKFAARVHTPTTATSAPGAGFMPPQIAVVVTLWSGQQVQRANYGRIYLPHPASPPGYTNGLLPTTWTANVATRTKTMINDVNGEVSTVGVGTYPAILSKVGTGQVRPIDKIGVGRVYDTQRRRRNALAEEIVYIDL